jgi:hypothetical protein
MSIHPDYTNVLQCMKAFCLFTSLTEIHFCEWNRATVVQQVDTFWLNIRSEELSSMYYAFIVMFASKKFVEFAGCF